MFGPSNSSNLDIVQVRMRFGFVLLQLIASSLLMLMQLCIMPVFLVYADLRRRILYRIMLSIALSDFLQLYAIWQFTLFEALGFSDWSIYIEKFASGVYIVAWDHLIVQHFLLALNRLIIILRAYYSPVSLKMNGGESRAEKGLFNSLLVFSWVVLLLLVLLFMTSMCGGVWDGQAVGFYYDRTLKCSNVFIEVELYFTITFPALSVLFYLLIVVMLKKTRNGCVTVVQVTGNNQSLKQRSPVRLLSVQEKRILLLSVLLFALITALIFAWYRDYRSPPWTLLFCCYLLTNSFLSLTMNSEYRSRFVKMLTWLMHFLVREKRGGQNVTKNGTKQANGVAGSSQVRNIVNGMGRPKHADELFIRRGHAVGPRCGRVGAIGDGVRRHQ
ncbi:hypothetical protein niasHS_003397 [Heterodera schachtii]|uniref:G-protein coupled receptors family 1 profile domain-containing protein n=1 Tax=Heterodera schachtii TaxID=97005 RepID=A0ABD2KGD9_HETSC